MFLIPKLGNHATTSDLSFEFIKYDPSNSQDMDALARHVALIRDRHVPVANQGKLLPAAVVRKVSERLARPFTMHNHLQAWRSYGARSPGRASPESCEKKWCQYDEAHDEYIYTQDWVDFFVAKLSDEDEYARVTSFRR